MDPACAVDSPPEPETEDHAGGYRMPAAKQHAAPAMARAPLLVWWLTWLACTGVLVARWLGTFTWIEAKELDAAAATGNLVVAALGSVILSRIGGRLGGRVRRATRSPEG